MIEVNLVDKMGSDLTVVNAARVSYENHHTELDEEKDIGLIKFLAKHKHWSPFGHCQVQFRITAPIFVARQLGKHQVGLVWNEVSRRYVSSEPSFYEPDGWRKYGGNSKQGSLQDEFVENLKTPNEKISERYSIMMAYCKAFYQELLDSGVCPEQARMVLPQSLMTQWYWTGSLMAFSRICSLRCAKDTQKETRDIADKIDSILEKEFPISWEAMRDS